VTTSVQPARRRTRWLIAGAVVLLVVAGGGIWWFTRPDPTLTISGRVGVHNADPTSWNGDCVVKGRFSDVAGAGVTVTDASGKVVGLARLGATGKPRDDYICDFAFSIEVPAGRGFYSIRSAKETRCATPRRRWPRRYR
jgi:hypothetical protein